LNANYIAIERKLRNNEYQDYQDYQIDCKNFGQFVMDQGVSFPQKKQLLSEFL